MKHSPFPGRPPALRGLALIAGALGCLLCTQASTARSVSLPPGFVAQEVVPGHDFTNPTAIAYLPDGRLLVAEKRGKVYAVRNGIPYPSPMWQAGNDINTLGDYGLMGLAVDPHYATNRYLYLLYTVDPDSGTGEVDATGFGRLIRIQVSAADSNVVDYASRVVLMGVSQRYGPLCLGNSHTVDCLRFAPDGSLLVSEGEGSNPSFADAGGSYALPFGEGPDKTDPLEDIGGFRSQSLNSLCGKILRIDPATGHGYPSNPYYDGNPASVRSRVWVYGVRNPFRMCLKPGTGSTNPADGNPGQLCIGDVGWQRWEEINFLTTGGANCGWPCFEGLLPNLDGYPQAHPAHLGCDSVGVLPEDPTLPTLPIITWNHDAPWLSLPPGMTGNVVSGVCWYTGTKYPAAYRNTLFAADLGGDWIRTFSFLGGLPLPTSAEFATSVEAPVDIITEPASGDLVYVALGTGHIYRLRYYGTGPNEAPVAVASAAPKVGEAPLSVQFSGLASTDADGDSLEYHWQFGESGVTADGPSPVHAYNLAGEYTVILEVEDGRGGFAADTLRVFALDSAAFPTSGIRDGFNRANGSIGPSWAGDSWAAWVNANALQVSEPDCAVRWAANFGTSQEAYVTLAGALPDSSSVALCLKSTGGPSTLRELCAEYDAAAGQFVVKTETAGQPPVVTGSPIPAAFAMGDRLGARALGNGVVMLYKNSELLGVVDVPGWDTPTDSGRIGVHVRRGAGVRLDNFGGGSENFGFNTAPGAILLQPAAAAFYATGDLAVLSATGTDLQDPVDSLHYEWAIDLHHNNHVHPDIFTASGPLAFYAISNHDDGTGVWWEVRLTVSDTGGLWSTTTAPMYPEINLRPEDLSVGFAPVTEDDTVTTTFTLRNLGRMPAPWTHWIVRADTTVLAQGDTTVPALGSVVVSRRASRPLVTGSYVLRVVADTLGTLPETGESDNAEALPLFVGPSIAGAPAAPPRALRLSAAHPNPSSRAVAFDLELRRPGPVRFNLYDSQGRRVWSETQVRGAGRWQLLWPGTGASGAPAGAGMYFARIEAGGQVFLRKLVRLR